MAYGDHIFVDRGTFTHHGIDIGDGTVVDLAGGELGKADAKVRRVSIVDFADGADVHARHYARRLPAQESVTRALGALGRPGYQLLYSNCEHFACWCATGEHASEQVDSAGEAGALVGTLMAPRAAVSVVSRAGAGPPLSGPNVMSGLAKVGGSAAGGLCVLAAAGGLCGAGTTAIALRDRAFHTEDERTARATGRAAGVVAGAAGGVGVVYAVGVAGVPGFSAAGLASGLSAVGAPLGGGMVAGVGVVVLTPALLAIVLGLLAAFIHRRLLPPGPTPNSAPAAA
jgi:hypothetical protein